jgi:hypothetical protein
MMVYKSSKMDPKHLINISIVSGVFASSIYAKDGLFFFPLPNEWKGRLNKEEHCGIIEGLCPSVRKFITEKKIAKTNEDHVIDAVGLGLWTIEKEKKHDEK